MSCCMIRVLYCVIFVSKNNTNLNDFVLFCLVLGTIEDGTVEVNCLEEKQIIIIIITCHH